MTGTTQLVAGMSPVSRAWAAAGWFTLLFLLLYGFVLERLTDQWFNDLDMSHGPFVPIFAGYVFWTMRDSILASPARPSYWGIVPMILGFLLLCSGPPSLPTFAFLSRVSLLLSLLGLITLLRGTPTIRAAAYPLGLMLFAIPLPGFIYERITLPLQLGASQISEFFLTTLGYSVLREGNILHLPRQAVAVAEACSGLRSLLSLLFLSQVYAFLFDSRPWMRAFLAIAMVPLAVLANAGRITFVAAMGQTTDAWFEGTLHDSTAWVIFVVAFAALICVHAAANQVTARLKPIIGR